MWKDNGMTPWERFKASENCESGYGHYFQAEIVAVYRAVDVLKVLGPGQSMTFNEWIKAAVEFANQFPNIGCKYRDTVPYFLALGDYGLVAFDGDPETNEDWDAVKVRITAKGYLAERREYFIERVREPKDEPFDPDQFQKELEKGM